jgi:hypothetical protein
MSGKFFAILLKNNSTLYKDAPLLQVEVAIALQILKEFNSTMLFLNEKRI